MDTLDDFMATRAPTPNRPLMGLTVLAVEDSRFASEALRLLCLHSGARIRRADSLAHARRHLGVYRPAVVIVDLGLPDGPGETLIADLARATPRVDVLLATSGDSDGRDRALAAGADGFIAKPIANLARFQAAILRHLPPERQPLGPRLVSTDQVTPDLIAFHDDLAQIALVLDGEEAGSAIDYVTQFLGGVARSAADHDLDAAVAALAAQRTAGGPLRPQIAHLAALVQERLDHRSLI